MNKAFREQEEQHQEWGPVMVVPQAVDDSMADMGKKTQFGTEQTGRLARRLPRPGLSGRADGLTPHPACLMVFLDSL